MLVNTSSLYYAISMDVYNFNKDYLKNLYKFQYDFIY